MKQPLCIIVALATIFSIVLSACAQSTPPPTTTAAPPPKTSAPTTTAAAPSTTKPPAATTVAPSPSAPKPQYGGTLTVPLTADITNWDSGLNGNSGSLEGTVYQKYMTANWLRGPAGSNVTNFAAGGSSTEDASMPQLMESWTMPAPGVWVLNLRKGVHWQNVNTEAGKLMNGREVTIDDIVSSFNRLLAAPRSWINVAQPVIAKAVSIEKTGPMQVTIKTPVDPLTSWSYLIDGGGFCRVYPPEVVAKYGDIGDWHNAVGTGPFILTDYVKGSSLTFAKNPDYWETNPIGPGKGDKLPYLDGVKQLIITDLSTRISAFRTGKVDLMDGTATLASVDAQPLLKANAQIQSVKYLSGTPWAITMRTDKKDLPYAATPNGLKVRQALMMATDFKGLSDTLFGGDAEIDVWPVNKFLSNMYVPLSEMPQNVKDLYTYNPTKAKALLAEAGYPNGFTTSIVVSNVDQTKIDDLTAFQAMWAKVGVTLKIDARDNAVYVAMGQARSSDEMAYRFLWALWTQQMYMSPDRGGSTSNHSYISPPDNPIPAIEDIFKGIDSKLFVDWPGAFATYKKLKPILLEGAWYIVRPTPYTYNVYWPYVQNYFGQSTTNFTRYIWIDQAQKKALGF